MMNVVEFQAVYFVAQIIRNDEKYAQLCSGAGLQFCLFEVTVCLLFNNPT